MSFINNASREVVKKYWFFIVGLMLLSTIINTVAKSLQSLRLIWSDPMPMSAFGVLYRNRFGCSSPTLV